MQSLNQLSSQPADHPLHLAATAPHFTSSHADKQKHDGPTILAFCLSRSITADKTNKTARTIAASVNFHHQHACLTNRNAHQHCRELSFWPGTIHADSSAPAIIAHANLLCPRIAPHQRTHARPASLHFPPDQTAFGAAIPQSNASSTTSHLADSRIRPIASILLAVSVCHSTSSMGSCPILKSARTIASCHRSSMPPASSCDLEPRTTEVRRMSSACHQPRQAQHRQHDIPAGRHIDSGSNVCSRSRVHANDQTVSTVGADTRAYQAATQQH